MIKTFDEIYQDIVNNENFLKLAQDAEEKAVEVAEENYLNKEFLPKYFPQKDYSLIGRGITIYPVGKYKKDTCVHINIKVGSYLLHLRPHMEYDKTEERYTAYGIRLYMYRMEEDIDNTQGAIDKHIEEAGTFKSATAYFFKEEEELLKCIGNLAYHGSPTLAWSNYEND